MTSLTSHPSQLHMASGNVKKKNYVYISQKMPAIETCVKMDLKNGYTTHTNESCHVWMSHVTCGWVMSHMNESCHIWMSHVTYEWVMSHMNESCHIWMSHVTYWRVCPFSPLNSSWPVVTWREKKEKICVCVKRAYKSCHMWMSHVTCEWVMSHMNEGAMTSLVFHPFQLLMASDNVKIKKP